MFRRKRRQNKYLLDVKVRHRGQIKQRARAGAMALGVLLLLAVGGAGLYGVGRLVVRHVIFQNPHFAVMEIQVVSNGVLTRPMVLQFAGVPVGQNIFSVDIRRAQQNLAMIPMVRRVDVRRELPQRLHIEIEERIPVARVYAPQQSDNDLPFYMDRQGVIFKPLALANRQVLAPAGIEQLPTLTGVPFTELRVGRALSSEQAHRAVELLDKLAQSAAGTLLDVQTIHVGRPRELTLVTRERMVVRISTDDFGTQLRRLSAILVWAEQRQRPVQMVDLTVPRGVPVTFAGSL